MTTISGSTLNKNDYDAEYMQEMMILGLIDIIRLNIIKPLHELVPLVNNDIHKKGEKNIGMGENAPHFD